MMPQSSVPRRPRNPEGGNVLFFTAATLFVLLGMGALAIDLVSLYAARSEAQRAADAAALAGAKKLVESTFLSGGVSPSTAAALARQEAITVGGQNQVGGLGAQIASGDVTFTPDPPAPPNPRITVRVRRTAASGNAMPTFFAKALGFASADVSAAATAEAFNPSGGDTPIGTSCVKPWVLPNCDPASQHGGNPNNCNAKFVDETTGAILSPGPWTAGVIGQPLDLKMGDPQQAPAPSKYYPIQIPPGDDPALCPDPNSIGCSNLNGGGGGALYRKNIACCNTNQLVCGQTLTVDMEPGNMVGPTGQGVSCLIHQGPGNQGGQDIINTTVVPFQITGGSNNPNPALRGQLISSSDSIVTVPLYDGHELCPGGSCGFSITIVGFLQVFVKDTGPPQETVHAVILNVAGCGASGGGGGGGGGGAGGGGGGVVGGGGGGGLIPVRLVRP